MTWETVRRLLVEQAGDADVEVGGPASALAIVAAEKQLGRFPSAYRRFLEEFGWIEGADYVVNGLGDTVPGWLDVVAETLSEREELEPGLPAGHVALANDGAGNVYCMRVGLHEQDAEPPVLLRNHELGAHEDDLEPCADDFSSWLYDQITRREQ